MLGPFPWWYSHRAKIVGNGIYKEFPLWNEEKQEWHSSAWRIKIPPEWRFRSLKHAPLKLKVKLGLVTLENPQTTLEEFTEE